MSELLRSVSPADPDDEVGCFPVADASAVAQAIDRARRAFPGWRDAGLVDCFAEKGIGPHTKSMSSTNPRNRIDYLWAGGTLKSRIQSARILYEGNFRTNPDDPASFALSDHIPVLAEFN